MSAFAANKQNPSARWLIPILQQPFHTAEEAQSKIKLSSEYLELLNDKRFFFAKIYSLTIQSGLIWIKNNRFENPKWVKQLVLDYANLYRETLLNDFHGKQQKIPKSWQLEFNFINSTSFLAEDQHSDLKWTAELDAVYGIHVHIKRDLVEALWITEKEFSSASKERDFFKITEALGEIFPKIWQLYLANSNSLHLAPNIEQKVMFDWISRLRADAWTTAKENKYLSKSEKVQFLNLLDSKVSHDSYWHGILLPLLN